MTNFAYKPCTIAIRFRSFLTSVGILKDTFALFLKYLIFFPGKFQFHQRNLVVYLRIFSSNFFYENFGYFRSWQYFQCQCSMSLYIFYLLLFFKINFHLIAIFIYLTELSYCCDIFIIICLHNHRRNFMICGIYWCSSKTNFLIHQQSLSFQKDNCNIMFSVLNDQSNEPFYHLD